jgi:hypothetical protein
MKPAFALLSPTFFLVLAQHFYIKTPKFFSKRFAHVAITNNPNDFSSSSRPQCFLGSNVGSTFWSASFIEQGQNHAQRMLCYSIPYCLLGSD